jgi:general secretion pathway protein I
MNKDKAEGGRRKAESGFTLIEVIVAIVILSISFVLVMQLFSGGLRAARSSCDYTRAIVLAKDKMDELSAAPVNDSGEFEDGFKWESEAEAYKKLEGTDSNLVKLKVKVIWDDAMKKNKSIELVSLRLVSTDEK